MNAMHDSILVRPARARDKAHVLAFCQKTFRWGDYIEEVWDIWLHDHGGQMLVGVVRNQPVGLMHVALLDDEAAWIEGVRVQPDLRRRGIASAMEAYARSYAREQGCTTMRLATGTDNRVSQQVFETRGYKRIARYGEWTAKPIPGEFLGTSVAAEQDLSQVLALRREYIPYPIVATPEWHWEKLGDDKLRSIAAKGDVRVSPHGFAIFRETMSHDCLMLHALVGEDGSMREFAAAARYEAAYRGYNCVQALLVDDPAINRALANAGFEREGGMFIYEQALE